MSLAVGGDGVVQAGVDEELLVRWAVQQGTGCLDQLVIIAGNSVGGGLSDDAQQLGPLIGGDRPEPGRGRFCRIRILILILILILIRILILIGRRDGDGGNRRFGAHRGYGC